MPNLNCDVARAGAPMLPRPLRGPRFQQRRGIESRGAERHMGLGGGIREKHEFVGHHVSALD